MYIRRTVTRSLDSGEQYFSFRLVRSERIAGRVRQVTLLNLGRNFSPAQDQWQVLCARIEDNLAGGAAVPADCEPGLEREAQRLAALLLARQSQPALADRKRVPETVEIESLELAQMRSVGVERVALWALGELQFADALEALGMSRRQIAAVIGMTVGRMAGVGSPRAIQVWWREQSALGELLGVDLQSFGPTVLSRAGDNLLRYRKALETHLTARLQALCGPPGAELLYALTRPCVAPAGAGDVKDHSELRDSLSITLGLACDHRGVIHRSVSATAKDPADPPLAAVLAGLAVPRGAMVALGQGLASAENLALLREHGYGYLVVSREGIHALRRNQPSHFDPMADALELHQIVNPDRGEVRLYCRSPAFEFDEQALVARLTARLEAGLKRLAAGLAKPGGERCPDKLTQRIEQLRARCGAVGKEYCIELAVDGSGERVLALTWAPPMGSSGSRPAQPGAFCLRSSATDWDAERLWRAFLAVSDVDALVGDFRPEPEPAVDSLSGAGNAVQLLISVLACQCVQLVRRRLNDKGLDVAWTTVRRLLAGQSRVTTTVRRADGRTLHVRKATRPTPEQLAIYQALGLDPTLGGVQQTVI